jgi:hypothetical protein
MLEIALHLEPAPECPPAVLDSLLERLLSLGFKVENEDAGILVSRKNGFPTLHRARIAVGQAVREVGAVLLDSRMFLLRKKRRRKRPAP